MALIRCQECTKQISDKAKNCPNCGYSYEVEENAEAPAGLIVLSFLIPIVGLIIYATNISKQKTFSNSCGISALIGFILASVIISFMFLM